MSQRTRVASAPSAGPPTQVYELYEHSVQDLKRKKRDIMGFLGNAPGNVSGSYSFPALEALELVTEALAYAELREQIINTDVGAAIEKGAKEGIGASPPLPKPDPGEVSP